MKKATLQNTYKKMIALLLVAFTLFTSLPMAKMKVAAETVPQVSVYFIPSSKHDTKPGGAKRGKYTVYTYMEENTNPKEVANKFLAEGKHIGTEMGHPDHYGPYFPQYDIGSSYGAKFFGDVNESNYRNTYAVVEYADDDNSCFCVLRCFKFIRWSDINYTMCFDNDSKECKNPADYTPWIDGALAE